jgi:hypothetical protein
MELAKVAGLSLGLTIALSLAAQARGLLFEGFDTYFTVVVVTAACVIVGWVTAVSCQYIGKPVSTRQLSMVVLLLSTSLVALSSRVQTNQKLKIFLQPMPVSSEVKIIHGRTTLHCGYTHFTAPQSLIAAAIQAKQLIEVPALSGEDGLSHEEITARTISAPWDWWQPATMPKGKLFYKHHKSQAPQGWHEGWWVNEQTNEVYAFIGG